MISHMRTKIMIDCGTSWLGRLGKIKADHIILTHAHPDHAFGLKNGAPCPVWATQATFDYIQKFPIKQKHLIQPRKKIRIAGVTFEPFPVLHSIRCPAVGYRITCKKIKFFYVPDVAYIPDIDEAFQSIQFYIGDGATPWRPMIRKNKQTGEIFGHATIRQQLTWCHKQHVPKMIITHCGSEIVSKEKLVLPRIQEFAKQRGVEVVLAYDGLELSL